MITQIGRSKNQLKLMETNLGRRAGIEGKTQFAAIRNLRGNHVLNMLKKQVSLLGASPFENGRSDP